MTKLPDYKVKGRLEWKLLPLPHSAVPVLKYPSLVLQPYPMYPATTSLVNVVPKLSSTGRDLLQVTSATVNRSHAHFSFHTQTCVPYISMCILLLFARSLLSLTAQTTLMFLLPVNTIDIAVSHWRCETAMWWSNASLPPSLLSPSFYKPPLLLKAFPFFTWRELWLLLIWEWLCLCFWSHDHEGLGPPL